MDAIIMILSLLLCAIIFVAISTLLTHEPTDIVCGSIVKFYTKEVVENYCYVSSMLDVAVILPAPSLNNVICVHTLWDCDCIIEKVPTELFNKIKSDSALVWLRARKHKFDKKYTFLGVQEKD